MNELQTAEPKSIIQDMADRFGMDKRAFEATLKATVVPANVSNEQFVAFLLVAKQYHLNPITKEIYAFPARNGGIQPIVGIDGWCNIINNNPALDGIEFEDKLIDGKMVAITCKIFRKDRAHPTECTEYLSECFREKSEPWTKWPARMLRHKALIQCARYAFGLSGIVDQDEAERAIDQSENLSPYDIDVTKKKTPFNNAAARNTWHKNVRDSYSNAKSQSELLEIRELNNGMVAALEQSGDQRDSLSLDDLDQHYQIMWKRLSPIIEEEPTFDPEEVPALIKDLENKFKQI